MGRHCEVSEKGTGGAKQGKLAVAFPSGPVASPPPFDARSARAITEARLTYLDFLIKHWPGCALRTALDVGTGTGYFAGHLSKQHDLQVTALDLRPSNVEEARRRHPKVEFLEADVEGSPINVGKFDLVTAMGLFYHLENPFRAARNLADTTGSLLVIESMIAPGRQSRAWMLDEFPGEDQGRFYVAWHLTESCLVKLLYRAGIPYVYRMRFIPPHPQFRGGVLRRRARTVLIGSRIALPVAEFELIAEPHYRLDRAYYCRSLVRQVLRPLLTFRRSTYLKSGPRKMGDS
jgi:SAM-dependent methyltransferase